MRCSEASFSVRACSAVVACLFSLAIARADDVPATEHETRKPQHTNQLAKETSPYLLLHAHNPVDWRPWGPEALQAAKDANRPIFLSVGYSSCYWCHVMEREVFENEEIAAYLNEHFICIKVDREERPDIDDQYMLALQLYFQATGSAQGGGWPMSMFLTPDAKPFAGGTYFPAEDKPGQPGFKSVAEQIHTLWTTREADLRNNADFLASAVARHSQPGLALETVELDKSLVEAAMLAIMASNDGAYGGFGVDHDAPEGPKFPSAPMLSLLEQHALKTSQPDGIVQALDHTLTRMAMGGIRDHLGGGFHRYSVDREWRVPHFEKMLYDQALLIEVYTSAWERTKNPLYRQVVEETADFVLREMTSPEGGFYSSLDAETDGVEGQYFVWSREEIESSLGPDDARVFAAAYGLDEPSKFEHGYVLFLPRPLEQAAQALNLSSDELEKRLASMRERLLAARTGRPALLRDEKILTSWNGLMIGALASAGFALDRPDYLEAADHAARFLLTNVRDEEGRLLHSYAGGRAGIQPFLEDYAYLINGLLMLYGHTERTDLFESARQLTNQQFILFWDEGDGGFYSTADDHEPLLARMKDANDSVLPSPNAVSVWNLLALSGDEHLGSYRDPARQTIELFAPALRDQPASLPTMAIGLGLLLQDETSRPATTNVPTEVPADGSETLLALAPKDEIVPAAEASADDARKHDKITAAVYLSVDKVPAGGECNVAVVLNVKEGWHINANPAQPDYLIPTELTAALPEKFELTDIKYPKGEEFMQQGSDEPLVVYEGKVILYGKLKAPASAAGKTASSEFTVRYQVCNDQMCLRPMKLALKGQVAIAAQGEQPQAINQSLFKPKRPQPQ